jgi:hypothetical protein
MSSVRRTPISTKSKSFHNVEPITFGLELEFNLAFNEGELHETLIRHSIPYNTVLGSPCVKQLTDNEHRMLLALPNGKDEASHDCRHLYPSWAISMPANANDAYLREAFNRTISSASNGTGMLRGYIAEPLLIAQRAVRARNPTAQIDVCAFMCKGDSIPMPNAGTSDFLRRQSANTSH